jgi:hypothetical protein
MSKKRARDDSRVQHGPPPETWLWDLYPLAENAWGNVPAFNDGSGDGHTIDIRRWEAAKSMTNSPLPVYRPAHAPLPPFAFRDGGVRTCYIPQPKDLEIVRRVLPDTPDPRNPSWQEVEAELIVAGHDPEGLRKLKAPTLLRMLEKAKEPEVDRSRPSKGRGGRKGLSESEKRRRRELASKWQQAKAAGVGQKQFCRDEAITLKELTRALNWAAQRRRRGD